MELAFLILGGITAGSAMAAMVLRNLVHNALCLTAAFCGLAGLFLLLGAEFVGFAQILVYVGAVAILIVFAILLTHGRQARLGAALASRTWVIGVAIAGLVGGCLVISIAYSRIPVRPAAPETFPVKAIGDALMTQYVLPLEVVGLLLTAALIGAVLISLPETRNPEPREPDTPRP